MKARITATDVLQRQDSKREAVNNTELLNENYMSNFYYDKANKSHHKTDVLAFMKFCAEHKNTAIEYCRPCICFMEEYIDDNQIRREFGKVLNKLDRDDLSDIIKIETKPFIHEMAQENLDRIKVCDRIWNNHIQVTEKVKDLNKYISEHSDPCHFDLVMWEICQAFDKFKMDNYIKLNASIEEAMFLFEKNNIEVDQNKVVDRCLDYYTLKEDYTPDDVVQYKQVIVQNPCVEYNTKKISHCGMICRNFKDDTDKTEEKLCNTVSNFFGGLLRDVRNNIDDIFSLLRSLCLQNHPLKEYILTKFIPEDIMNCVEIKDSDRNCRDLYKAINDAINKQFEYLNMISKENERDETILRLKSALYILSHKIKEKLDLCYTPDNIKNMESYSSAIFNFNESTDILTLTEFKKFKFNNLLDTCKEIDKMIRKKAKAIGLKIKDKVLSIKKKLFEEVSEYDMIDENGFIDFTVTSFIIDESDTSIYHEIFSDMCKELNSEYFIKEAGLTCYYLIQPDGAEIHVKQNTSVSLSESEEEEYLHHMSVEDTMRVTECMDFLEKFSNINSDIDIVKEAKKVFTKNPDEQYFNAFMEVSSYAGINKECIDDIYDNITFVHPIGESSFYFNTNFNEETYKPERNIPYTYQLEALSLMYAILEEVKENNKDQKNDKNNVKNTSNTKTVENTKNTKVTNKVTKEERAEKAAQAILKSVNNFKLVMQGIKKGFKNLSAKEQAACRNLDAGFSMLVKSMKNALVSDRREAIIKGSVIPSFSKCIKMGIALLGVTAINPLLGIIAAFGGFAASKRLTKKERALLLDDIDVELEMLEKEIQNAEARGQMKKLRALMRTRKELQRQYQRINMNIRVGKDIIPGSTAGMKQYN